MSALIVYWKSYRHETIELEKVWTLGHEQKSGRADVIVYTPERDSVLLSLNAKLPVLNLRKPLNKLKRMADKFFLIGSKNERPNGLAYMPQTSMMILLLTSVLSSIVPTTLIS